MGCVVLRLPALSARIVKSGHRGRDAWAVFESETPIVKAELNYTTDAGAWQDRNWTAIPAVLEVKGGRISSRLPQGTTVFYFNLFDNRDLVVSSEHGVLAQTEVHR